jgi:hypothetical protein
MGEIGLSEILRRALWQSRQITVQRRTIDGMVVSGLGRDEEVTAVYVLARIMGQHPTKAVGEHFGLKPAAAAQRVARARRAGLLPPTTKGAR